MTLSVYFFIEHVMYTTNTRNGQAQKWISETFTAIYRRHIVAEGKAADGPVV